MALPDATEVKAFLTGYGITDDVLNKEWIERRRDYKIIPILKRILGYDFVNGESVTEYLSGNGKETLMLSRRGMTALTTLVYTHAADATYNLMSSVTLDSARGILIAKCVSPDGILTGSIFRKGQYNIKAVYTMPPLTDDLAELILYQMAKAVLIIISNRTGGGDSLNAQGYGRSFGRRGKYGNLMSELDKDSAAILAKYSTGVVAA